MEEIIGKLRCENGEVRNVLGIRYQDENEPQRYEIKLEGTEDDLELFGYKSLYDAACAAYSVWPDNFEFPTARIERLGNFSDEYAEEGIAQIIALRFYDHWEIFLSPRKGEMIPAHLGSYRSLALCRRAVFAAFGDKITMS
jgi:hypothetical protein